MKNILSIILILIIFACDKNQNNKDLENPEQYVPNLLFREGAEISEEIQNELDFFEYINVQYLNTLVYLQNYSEYKYNADLFYNGKSSVMIKNLFDYEDSILSYNELFNFSSKGNLLKIINMENPENNISFNYNNSNHLAKIIENRHTIPMTKTEGHNITYYDSEKATDKLIFEYSGNLLIELISYKNMQFQGEISPDKKQIFSCSKNNGADFFIKYINDDKFNFFGKDEFIYFFKNNRIEYITRLFGKSDNDLKNLFEVYLFDYSSNNMTIRYYQKNSSSDLKTNLVLREILEVYGQLKNHKIDKVMMTRYSENKINYLKEHYYEYHFSRNILTGYNIFEKFDNDGEYKFDKGFHLVD